MDKLQTCSPSNTQARTSQEQKAPFEPGSSQRPWDSCVPITVPRSSRLSAELSKAWISEVPQAYQLPCLQFLAHFYFPSIVGSFMNSGVITKSYLVRAKASDVHQHATKLEVNHVKFNVRRVEIFSI